MKKRKKYNTQERELTNSAKLLLTLFAVVDLFPRPFESKTAFFKRQVSGYVPYKSYLNILNTLEQKHWIKIFKEKGYQYVKLTKKGVLETLLLKADIKKPEKWDGKFRMVVFDIPEKAKDKRRLLRILLKNHGFLQIQRSVYINPYPLNRDAIRYLYETGLDEYIRIFRIDQIDNDENIKKFFKL